MKQTIAESLPDTVAGLEIFIKECAKEINKFSRLQHKAQESLDVKTGKKVVDYGIHTN